MTVVDLSRLPAPDCVEPLDYETILADKRARLLAILPAEQRTAIAAALALESDPLAKLLELEAYAELGLRQRVNDAARALMLAYAKRGDLDQLAAREGVIRQVIDAGDPAAIPPRAPVYEEDDRLRRRTQLAWEGLSCAGSREGYEFHALTAAVNVLDVQVESPAPCIIDLYVVDRRGDGVPDAALLAAVQVALSDKRVRPMGDRVTVRAARPRAYTVSAGLRIAAGPDAAVVLAAARAALVALLDKTRTTGATVSLAMMTAALVVEGVVDVELRAPTANIVCAPDEFPSLVAIVLDRLP
ncbi:baseplate assembly protein [Chitinimonas koreensis]|uniref:baseplate assembly protein n=1 Tax=Chitinimonas koreensis TaxID=356302 RepID=UPI0004080F35|nr:baseplate J/gp47 family protein [Chitinimonas koreensis]QNM96391.1 baseplate J/gp47 family protein [Chitinimonas koreensis]